MSRQYVCTQADVANAGDHSGRIWHVARDGRVIGPLSSFELALAAKDGLLDCCDSIWKPGLPRWFSVVEVDGLLPGEPGTSRDPRPRERTGGTSRNLESASALYEKALAACRASGGVHVGRMPSRETATSCFPLPAEPAAPAPECFPQSWSPNWPVLIPDCFPPMDPEPVGPKCNPPNNNPFPGIVVELPSRTGVAQRIADNIACQIVRLMDQHGVKTFDDIATNERLRGLSGLTFEALPQTVKMALNQTIGRQVIEERIYDALIGLRTTSLSPSARSADLRQLVLDQAPSLAAAIDAAMASATSSIKTLLASKWASLSGWVGDGNQAPGRLPGAAGAYIEMHPAG